MPPAARSRRRWRPRHERPTPDRRAGLPGASGPPPGPRPGRSARADPRSSRDDRPAAGAALRSSVLSATPTRSPADGACSSPPRCWSHWPSRRPRPSGRCASSSVTPSSELSLEPPTDVPAFVLSSYERLPQLPPVALTWHDSDGSDKGRIYVDRSGAVRFDRFSSAEATEPSSYTILSANRISGMAPVGSEAVWVEPGHEAFGEDPRAWIRTVLNCRGRAGLRDGAGSECGRQRNRGSGLEIRRRRIRCGAPHAPLLVRRRDLARHRDPADPAHPRAGD